MAQATTSSAEFQYVCMVKGLEETATGYTPLASSGTYRVPLKAHASNDRFVDNVAHAVRFAVHVFEIRPATRGITMKTKSIIEMLESRIAPATLVNATPFDFYTDVDFDTVTVKIAKVRSTV